VLVGKSVVFVGNAMLLLKTDNQKEPTKSEELKALGLD
jgi:hypothetical protein